MLTLMQSGSLLKVPVVSTSTAVGKEKFGSLKVKENHQMKIHPYTKDSNPFLGVNKQIIQQQLFHLLTICSHHLVL